MRNHNYFGFKYSKLERCENWQRGIALFSNVHTNKKKPSFKLSYSISLAHSLTRSECV